MQNLRVSLVQANQVWENKDANYENYHRLLEEMNEETDLIVLPEMFDTGFSMNVLLAEEWKKGKGGDFLKHIAHRFNAAVYTSIMTKSEGMYLNRGVFVYPNGDMTHYDKRKAFGLGGEDQYFETGNMEKIVEFRGWKINLQICYDLRFPEIVRNRIESNGKPAYDLIVYVANWPEKRRDHWKTLIRARAIENQCFTVGVNRVGIDGTDHTYTGDSCATNALGIDDFCEPGQETVKTVLLSMTELSKIREMLPFLKDQ